MCEIKNNIYLYYKKFQNFLDRSCNFQGTVSNTRALFYHVER